MDLAVEVLKMNEPETGVYPDFAILARFASMIGQNHNMKDEPSRKLVSAMELRSSSPQSPDLQLIMGGKETKQML
jgi:hypothetical protein